MYRVRTGLAGLMYIMFSLVEEGDTERMFFSGAVGTFFKGGVSLQGMFFEGIGLDS